MNNKEIERKFLVKDMPNLLNLKKHKIKQGYISTNPVLRIRQKDDKYFFTFKGRGTIERCELESEISKDEFLNLCGKIEGSIIDKMRYLIPLGTGIMAELDVYSKELDGFCNVEVEFNTLDEANSFTPPIWFGDEITYDYKYTNAYLSSKK